MIFHQFNITLDFPAEADQQCMWGGGGGFWQKMGRGGGGGGGGGGVSWAWGFGKKSEFGAGVPQKKGKKGVGVGRTKLGGGRTPGVGSNADPLSSPTLVGVSANVIEKYLSLKKSTFPFCIKFLLCGKKVRPVTEETLTSRNRASISKTSITLKSVFFIRCRRSDNSIFVDNEI